MLITEDIVISFENYFLKNLISLLNKGELTVEDAKKAIQEYLALYPFNSSEDMGKKLKIFTQSHPLFDILNIKFMGLEEEKKLAGVLDKMRGHLKSNNIDAALQIAQNHS